MLRHDSGKTDETDEIIVQSSLGCYLTPIGALAGIMWFHMVRRDGTRYGMLVPRPVNLFWHGGLHFVICTVALCATLPGSHILWALITTGEKPAEVSVQVGFVAGLGAGGRSGSLVVSLWIIFRRQDDLPDPNHQVLGMPNLANGLHVERLSA